MPDIMLLAPIARLLDVSLDTLLAFQEDLTEKEVNELVRTVNGKMEMEDYAEVFRWAKKKMEQYPGSERLHLWMCVTLDANRIVRQVKDAQQYDDFIRDSLNDCWGVKTNMSEQRRRILFIVFLCGRSNMRKRKNIWHIFLPRIRKESENRLVYMPRKGGMKRHINYMKNCCFPTIRYCLLSFIVY